MKKTSKIVIGLVVVYFIIGIIVLFMVDPMSRGKFMDMLEIVIFWPIIFLWPVS